MAYFYIFEFSIQFYNEFDMCLIRSTVDSFVANYVFLNNCNALQNNKILGERVK